MADPTNPTSTVDPAVHALAQQKGVTDETAASLIKAAEAQKTFTAATVDYGNYLPNLMSVLSAAGVKLEDLGNLTGQQTKQLGLLSAALVNTRDAFTNLMPSETGRLGSFGTQMSDLVKVLHSAGPGTQIAIDATKQLAASLGKVGVPAEAVAAAIKKGGSYFASFAENVIKGADNALKFESIIMKAGASGGGLETLYHGLQDGSKAFTGIGEHLENLNGTYNQFISIQGQAARVTGISNDQLAQFTSEILRSNAGWGAYAKGIDVAGTHMNTLVAVTRLAQASGQDTGELLKNITSLVNDTGLSYKGATDYTTRFISTSRDLKVPIDNVKQALMGLSNSFKLWNNGGEQSIKLNQGLADSTNAYAEALKKTGLGGTVALELGEKLASQLGTMNEAQQAFISQSTGGPGGLQGALEFDLLSKKESSSSSEKSTTNFRAANRRKSYHRTRSCGYSSNREI